MAPDAQVQGYGNGTAQNVFKLIFNHPLSSKVKYEAYDNPAVHASKAVFPSTDTDLTTAHDIFIGVGGDSAIGLQDTTQGQSAVDWMGGIMSPGSNTASQNLLKGITNFVTQHGATIGANGCIYWNMDIRVPASFQTSSSVAFDLLIRYTFTSTTPTLTWKFNNETTGGTEGVPSWTLATPNLQHGIVHCRTGTATGGPYLANIPSTGSELTVEGYVTGTITV